MDNFASTAIAARKNRTETETDALGRTIIVRYMPRSKIQQITAWSGTDNNLALAMLLPAACVCQIDDKQLSWPASLAEIHAIMDILDIEGSDAASTAYQRLSTAIGGSSVEEAAKNSAGTPT